MNEPSQQKPHNRRLLLLTYILDVESDAEFIYINYSISKTCSQHWKKASKEYYGHIKEKNKLMPNVSAPIKCMTLQELLILE